MNKLQQVQEKPTRDASLANPAAQRANNCLVLLKRLPCKCHQAALLLNTAQRWVSEWMCDNQLLYIGKHRAVTNVLPEPLNVSMRHRLQQVIPAWWPAYLRILLHKNIPTPRASQQILTKLNIISYYEEQHQTYEYMQTLKPIKMKCDWGPLSCLPERKQKEQILLTEAHIGADNSR